MQKRNVLSALCVAAVLTFSSAGAWAEAMSDKQFTDLCWNGTAEQVKQALADGANPNATDKGNASRTALMFASAWDKPDAEKVQALLAAGADPNAKDKHGLTVLVYAAEKGNAEVIQRLLAAGAQVNGRTKDGETALMRAAMHRRGEAVKLLLAAGADTSLKDSDGLDALWHARNQADNDEVIRLLDSGAQKPAAQDAGAFSAADLKRMSTFVSNFVEVRFPDFDMQKGEAPANPALIYFGIWHNYTNNRASRVKPCPEGGCKHGNSVMEAKFVAESVKKYFDVELKHRSVSDADSGLRFHFDGRLYHFEAADGELASEAKVTRAVREGDIIRMMGDIYLEDDPNKAVGSFTVTAKPHTWNGKKTWAILSLKREWR